MKTETKIKRYLKNLYSKNVDFFPKKMLTSAKLRGPWY